MSYRLRYFPSNHMQADRDRVRFQVSSTISPSGIIAIADIASTWSSSFTHCGFNIFSSFLTLLRPKLFAPAFVSIDAGSELPHSNVVILYPRADGYGETNIRSHLAISSPFVRRLSSKSPQQQTSAPNWLQTTTSNFQYVVQPVRLSTSGFYLDLVATTHLHRPRRRHRGPPGDFSRNEVTHASDLEREHRRWCAGTASTRTGYLCFFWLAHTHTECPIPREPTAAGRAGRSTLCSSGNGRARPGARTKALRGCP